MNMKALSPQADLAGLARDRPLPLKSGLSPSDAPDAGWHEGASCRSAPAPLAGLLASSHSPSAKRVTARSCAYCRALIDPAQIAVDRVLRDARELRERPHVGWADDG
jgi:hypothetical protein